jgi:ferredoxin-NADP reductase
MQYKKLVISRIHEEVPGFKTFEFEPGHNIVYKAGQYLSFAHRTSLDEIRRSYSIISTPLLNEPLAIGVKRIQNGIFSRILTDRLKPGDVLYTTGAAGFFTLPENIGQYKQVFFFAAGSGITPIYSLIKTCLFLNQDIHVILVYSNATPEKTIFYNELRSLQEMFSNNFQLQFLFSNSLHLNMARMNRELLILFLSQYSTASKEKALFYICGPEAYMRMCTYTLQEQQVPKENIRRENFSIDKPPLPKLLPPDTDAHQVTIHYADAEHNFSVQHPDTILKAAKKHGISLPYSCEAGRCGSCAARCIKGKIWMSYNEVLTEKELSEGLILTCVGFPVGGDVELKID